MKQSKKNQRGGNSSAQKVAAGANKEQGLPAETEAGIVRGFSANRPALARDSLHRVEALDLAAQLAAMHDGIPFEVKLARMSPEMAAFLRTHNGELSVTGLQDLGCEAARELCQHPLLRLNFRHMELSDDLAEVLATHEGLLWIDGLKELSSAKAGVLTRHNGPVFVVDGTRMDKDAEERLQRRAFESPILCEGMDLTKERLRVKRMSAALAEGLVFFKEGWLMLDALEEITLEQSKLLGSGPRTISLNGLREISPSVAAALASGGIPDLRQHIPSLVGDDSHAEKLHQLRLNGLTELRVDVARAFTGYHGRLELDGLKTLRPEAAAHLARTCGTVSLKGLSHIDRETAQAFDKRKCGLELSVKGQEAFKEACKQEAWTA